MVGITCLLCKEPIRTLAELRAICRVNYGKPHWVRDVEEQGLRESEASAITQPGMVYAPDAPAGFVPPAVTQPGMVYAPDAPAEFVPPAVEPSPEPEPFEPDGGDFGGGGASGDFGGGGASGDFGGGGDAGGSGSSGGD